MTAEAAIHSAWGSYTQLVGAVPVDRVYTGLPPISDEHGANLGFDYVAIEVKSEANSERTSEGTRLFNEMVSFRTVSESYDNARAIDKLIVDSFNAQEIDTRHVNILDMRPQGRMETENEDDGVWEIVRDFEVKVFTPATA
jgi:hypothetical protein